MMNENNDNIQLLGTVAAAGEFCAAVQDARQMERGEFIELMIRTMPRLYLDFVTLDAVSVDEDYYLPSRVDEDYYESVRRGLEQLFGADDTYLETFEEDMKYSDTPVGASIAEGLADIFQDLYDFTEFVRETEDVATGFIACRENFRAYWAQTLCNVMRPLNHLYLHPSEE